MVESSCYTIKEFSTLCVIPDNVVKANISGDILWWELVMCYGFVDTEKDYLIVPLKYGLDAKQHNRLINFQQINNLKELN